MPSFGAKLKQEREKRKVTLEQISESTKIGTRMLQALEEDKFNQLPGGIFNKGFVRAYSRFVGLDEDQSIAEYLQASGDAIPPRTEPPGHEDAARESEQNIRRLDAISDTPTRQLPWGLFAAVLLVVALALSLWSHLQRERDRKVVRPAPIAATAPLPAAVDGGAEKAPGVSGSVTTPSAVPAPARESASASASPSAPAAAPNSVTSKTQQSVPAAAPATVPGEFTIVIQAREESWVSVTADGKAGGSELMAAGTEQTIRGRKQVIVKAGNAGGVDFRFNGKKLDTGGDYGEVKIVTFGPAGLIPNAPAPSPSEP